MANSTISISWFILGVLFTLVSPAAARGGLDLPCPADPFADPSTDFCNPLRYIASDVLTGIAFGLIVFSALAHTFFTIKQGALFMLALVIGEYIFAIGIGSRFGLHKDPQAQGTYIVEYLFVTLSPCAFIAANYVLLGRMARYLECDQHLLIRPQRITAVFISSDVSTFLIQAAGGGISIAANDSKGAMTGSNVFLAGLALQLFSFFLFTCLYTRFLYRVYSMERQTWTKDQDLPWYKDWRSLAGALFLSCIGILIRSVYRTVELSEGFQGPIARSEKLFFGLDTLPLFIAIVIYVPFWPGRFIPRFAPAQVVEEVNSHSSEAEKGSTV